MLSFDIFGVLMDLVMLFLDDGTTGRRAVDPKHTVSSGLATGEFFFSKRRARAQLSGAPSRIPVNPV